MTTHLYLILYPTETKPLKQTSYSNTGTFIILKPLIWLPYCIYLTVFEN